MAVSVFSSVLLTGCGGSAETALTGQSSSDTTEAVSESTTTLSKAEVDSLKFMREEEKLARDTYLTLYDAWGSNIFNNIASSEQTHTDAIYALMQTYGVEDPAQSEVGQFTDQELQALYDALVADGMLNENAALWVGALIEETDIEDIVLAMNDIENTEMLSVYENLLCGSRNHLRAFVNNIENKGGVYSTQIQAIEDVVNDILTTPQEQCNWTA